MRIFIDLMLHEVQMMRIVSKLQQEAGSSPKKYLVLARYREKYDRTNADAEKAFRKLTAVEVVEHSRNGHCWLTDKGTQALL